MARRRDGADAHRPGHPLPRRRRRPRGEGRQLRRPARRRRPGRAGGPLRRRGRRRAGVPRHHRVVATPATPSSTWCARTAEQVFIPFTIGGGHPLASTTPARLLRAGADKVSVNTAAVRAARADRRAGRRVRHPVRGGGHRRPPRAAGPATVDAVGFEVYTHGGRTPTGLDAVAWAAEVERLGRRRDPAHLDGPRRHPRRLRPAAHPRGGRRGQRAGHRLRRRRHARAPGRGRHRRAAPTPCWPPASSTSASTPWPRPRPAWPPPASPSAPPDPVPSRPPSPNRASIRSEAGRIDAQFGRGGSGRHVG